MVDCYAKLPNEQGTGTVLEFFVMIDSTAHDFTLKASKENPYVDM